MNTLFLNTNFPTQIILASSPLTETAKRIHNSEVYGAGGAILKTCSSYTRKRDYDTRKVIFSSDHSRYYAYSSFDREILTADEGLKLYHDAVEICSIPIIPSVTALSLNLSDWLPLCLRFQDAGAEIIQLDFFYLGSYLSRSDFSAQLCNLLSTLVRSLHCTVMPKINIDLPADYIFQLIAKTGVKAVSLLDSVRVPVTDSLDGATLPFSSTSCFGAWQLPLSLRYAYIARQYGLEVCGGGGITDRSSVMQMQSCGAALVQLASPVLLHGYDYIQELLPVKKQTALPDLPLSHKHYRVQKDKCTRCHICAKPSTWCDAISIGADGFPFIQQELCENCGWCVGRCPAHAIAAIDKKQDQSASSY